MLYRFSIILRPSKELIALFKEFKIILKQVGDYSSEKSEAHFTIMEFNADESIIPIIEKFLRRFTSLYENSEYRFDDFAMFPEQGKEKKNGTFYATPDEYSKKIISEMMKNFHLNFPIAKPYKVYRGYYPHMTVGRGLSSDQLNLAVKLFTNIKIEISTNCTIALRKRIIDSFEQFSIISEFEFTGNGVGDGFSKQLSFGF